MKLVPEIGILTELVSCLLHNILNVKRFRARVVANKLNNLLRGTYHMMQKTNRSNSSKIEVIFTVVSDLQVFCNFFRKFNT